MQWSGSDWTRRSAATSMVRTAALALSMVVIVASWTSAHAAEPQATPAEQIRVAKGFVIERLYSVPEGDQGSWVAMTVDDKGRLIASDQYGKLYRITIEDGGDKPVSIETIPLEIGMAQGLCYAFDSLYVSVNGGKAPYTSGIYRLLDTNGDDQFDKVVTLRKLAGGGEHGPHAIIKTPDGKGLYFCAGNHTNPTEFATSSVPRLWEEDQLLSRMPDAKGHAADRRAPGGWICKFDPEGKQFELVSMGYRNQYDIDVSLEGDLFTYDADMEWDVGAPWYRPTRVCFAPSGSEFGWRTGTGKFPPEYPDTLPATLDIGPGSPTGIVFGTGAKFPEKYQRALFIADWSYGMIYAVHLDKEGAAYSGQAEIFCSAQPLPVTDMVIRPQDGAFYFAIGGRKAQSGLYRIRYTGSESTDAVEPRQDILNDPLHKLRRKLESLYESDQTEKVVAEAWPHLDHEDRFIRFAARTAIEHQPLDAWKDKALAEDRPRALVEAMIALTRVGSKSLQDDQPGKLELLTEVVKRLQSVDYPAMDELGKIAVLRAYGLAFTRLSRQGNEKGPIVASAGGRGEGPREGRRGDGRLSDVARTRFGTPRAARLANAVGQAFLPHFTPDGPGMDAPVVRQELARLMCFTEVPGTIDGTLALMKAAGSQEEQIHYVYCLRTVLAGWTDETRETYFAWFQNAAAFRGGMSFEGFLTNIRNEALKNLTAEQKAKIEPLLAPPAEPTGPEALPTEREIVKAWTVDELLAKAEKADMTDRNIDRGRMIYAEASCAKCHRFRGDGGISGPDLTSVSGRFGVKDILESIIEPNKVISDQYAAQQFVMADGRIVTGRVVNVFGGQISVMPNLLDPSQVVGLAVKDIEETRPSPNSMMPSGLVDVFDEEEILDLVAYLRSRGVPNLGSR